MSADLLTREKALIFRITHKGNIPTIMAKGCHCRAAGEGQAYVEIGNQELIVRRQTREVLAGAGGTLSEYIPFYFTPFTPMLYNIKTGYGVPQQDLDDIVILVSSLPLLQQRGIPFVFTDRHAYLKAAQFSADMNDLDWIIWPTLRARDFKKDDADKFEKYQAEALVYRHLPVTALQGIVCRNEATRALVQTEADRCHAAVKVIRQPSWYL